MADGARAIIAVWNLDRAFWTGFFMDHPFHVSRGSAEA
jgi:hypothetical protein